MTLKELLEALDDVASCESMPCMKSERASAAVAQFGSCTECTIRVLRKIGVQVQELAHLGIPEGPRLIGELFGLDER